MKQRIAYKIFFIGIFLWMFIGNDFARVSHGAADAFETGEKAGLPVAGVDIEIYGAHGNTDYWKKAARNLILFQNGEKLTSGKLNQAVTALKSSGLFVMEDVQTRKNDSRGLYVYFRLRLLPRIQDIKITGNFPVFEREVLNAMTVYTGDAFHEETLPEQSELILRLLKKQGYISPKVSVQAIQDKDSGHYVLQVDLDKGNFFYIDRFELHGNTAFSDFRLKMRLHAWEYIFLPRSMSRYQKKELEEEVKNLIEFYRKHQYAEVKVKPEVEMDPANRKVRIVLQITEGPLYDIQFKGNDQFWDWTLQEDLHLFKEGNQRDFSLRKTTRKIRERYHEKGYMDCRVKMEIDPENDAEDSVRRVCFRIEEGLRSIVRDIKIIGNHSIAETEIQKQIITEKTGLITSGALVRQIVDDDIRGIISLYIKKGFPDVTVDEEIVWTKSQDHPERYGDIRFTVHEGRKIMVSSVKFKGLTGFSAEQAIQFLVMKPGDPFREYMIQSDENTLAMHIAENGYPHVKIQAKKIINTEKGEAYLTYEVRPGPDVKTGELFTVGNFRTNDTVVHQEFSLAKGKPFSMLKMLESQRNIQNINAFKTARVKPIGLKEASETVHFLVEVEEKKPYSAQASIGYDTSRLLYVNTRVGDLNLLGLNKEVWIGLEVSQIGNRGEIGLTEPRFLGTRIKATTNLFWEKWEEMNKSFGTKSYGARLLLKRNLPYHFSAGLTIGYERKEQYLHHGESLSVDEEDAYEPRGILVTTPSLVYNSVDSFIRPRKGLFSSIGIDFSKGLENALDNFITYRYEIRMYTQIHNRIVVAVRGRVGHIVPSGEESVIPEDQLFFLGGLSSVRGYDENRLRVDAAGKALGGRTELVGSIETRFDIGFNLELSPFYDIGSVRNSLNNEGSDSFRSSAGLSLRYLTPYCPIGVQYGYLLDKQEEDNEKGRFYFTIGYTF